MARVYNFSAGPSTLPEPVLRKAASEMLDWRSSGQSVMEMSHRSSWYQEIIDDCESSLRKVMGVPDNYKVLFLQGGASTQFAMVPLNLLPRTGKADYVVSGQFSKKAYSEGKKLGAARLAATSEDGNYSYIPDVGPEILDKDASYLHICYNNTIYGTRYSSIPETGAVPLVADVSSCILSEPLDVPRFGLLYAGAQKNMGPAGLTVVILREDLAGEPLPGTPTMMSYKTHVENNSMYNTPPTYSIYICGLVLDWIQHEVGGLEAMAKFNQEKARLLYDYLDSSRLFTATAREPFRSIMNVCFVTGDPELDKLFVKEAGKAGMVNIKGHRSVGGMRASIYNAMPMEGVKALVDFMAAFEKEHW